MARKKKGKDSEETLTVSQQKTIQYEHKRFWINMMCLGGALMAIFDFSTHVLAVNVLAKAYKDYTTLVTPENLTAWSANPVCKYTKSLKSFTDMNGDETELCSALGFNPAENTTVGGKQCDLNVVLISNKSANPVGLLDKALLAHENSLYGLGPKDKTRVKAIGREPLDDEFFVVNAAKFRFRRKTLNATRFAQIAFLLLSMLLTGWFCYNVWTKRTARLALLRAEHKPPELVEEEQLIEKLYTDPPMVPFDDHAPKAAPTYWVADRSLQPVTPVAAKKKAPKRRCADCKRYLEPEEETCQLCAEEMDDLQKVENMTRKEKINEYMFSFCKAAEVRLMIMMVADMPALVVYVFYMAFTDDSQGLHCHVEAAQGELGQYGEHFNQVVAIICCLGGFVSVFLLFFQVVYIESMAKKEDRAFRYHTNYEQLQERTICVGIDIQISIAMIPFAIAPVLAVCLLTGAKDILSMSDYWWVVAGLFGIPWLGICVVFVMGLLDFCGFIDSCEGGAEAAGDAAGEVVGETAEGCCECCDGCIESMGECCTSTWECCTCCGQSLLECCC